MTQDEFTKLMNLRRKVVEMNLTWVEWRSCDLGKRPEVLDRFRIFFGATRMGAPMQEGIFGHSPVVITPLDRIPQKYTAYTAYSYPDKWNPTVIIFMKLNDSRDPTDGVIFAVSSAEVDKWIKTHINPKGTVKGNTVRVHGLWKDPDQDRPLDNPGLILPLDSDYEKNIRYSEGPMFTGIMQVVAGAGSLSPTEVKQELDRVFERR